MRVDSDVKPLLVYSQYSYSQIVEWVRATPISPSSKEGPSASRQSARLGVGSSAVVDKFTVIRDARRACI